MSHVPMKKILFGFICLLFALTAPAQDKVTLQDLQGKWILITYSTINTSLDIKTGKGTLTETGKSLGPQFGERLIADIEGYAENLKIATLEIKGNHFEQILYDVVKSGPFTIEDKDKYQLLNANFDDGTNASMMVGIKDGKLYLGYPKTGKSFIFEKAQ